MILIKVTLKVWVVGGDNAKNTEEGWEEEPDST